MAEDTTKKDNTEESEIDLMEWASKLWINRRRLIKWSICGAIIGLIIAFSIPKEYNTNVLLSPEINPEQNNTLSSLASMAGLSMGSNATDAYNPMLYPDVVNSIPFMTGLFDVKVKTKDGKEMTVQEYMKKETKAPWWSFFLKLPGKLIGAIIPSDKEEQTGANHQLNNFRLTKKETSLVEALRKRVVATGDPKIFMVTVNVEMQDPMVSAMLADTVVSRLQDYITDYRTNKARQDLDYAIKINEEARQNYFAAQQKFAEYLDSNHGLTLYSSQVTQQRLENDVNLTFGLYNQTAQNVQMAEAKVQEKTPIYAIITPATVPLKASKPRKLLILISYTFLAFVCCAAWILFGQKVKELKANFKLATAEVEKDEDAEKKSKGKKEIKEADRE